ncbi:MAG: EAL domain-containing protein [Pseudomonadota bacterium]|nr:EAL domain-containing protein [Pseudomonadota bacterium]
MPRSKTLQLEEETFPQEAQKLLTDALYADAASLIAGATIMAAVAFLCWRITDALAPLMLAFAAIASASLRIAIARQRRWRRRNWYDFAFTSSALVYLFCSGALTFWAFGYSNDPFVLTITLIVSIINSMGIALRSFAVEKVVKLHTAAIIAPVTAAFALRGGYFYFAAVTQIVLAWHIYNSAGRLRKILISEMSYRRRSDTVATRFRFAIDNMSHGMCMIDSDLRIVVSNAELSESFGLSGARPLQGARFSAIVRLARRRGSIDAAHAEKLLAAFDETRAPDSLARLELPGLNGRVHDLTLKRHDAGGWVLVAQDVTDQRRAREALDVAARFDPMTGLPNRRSFEARLAETLAAARGGETRTEALFLDLDGFKQINDTLGHKFGDRVLEESARRLRDVAQGAYVSRWGGDEFVILRTGGDDAGTCRFADNVIRELSRPIWIEGAEVVVGASVGAAICVGAAISMETLLQQADMALYSAKRESRGACRLYEVSMSEEAQGRRLLELDLQAALASRSFELYYQPIVDMESGKLVSFEALARWNHPTRGAVSPALFVPVLEDLNLMNAFGAWALHRACADAVRWPQSVRVGVNVSTRQMDTVVESVRRALSSSGLDATRLELEITETAALAAGDAVNRTLETLREQGVRIALDDFGTGYSSLSHLMRLPLDKVKIDKSFTQQLGKSRKADVLVANIARLSSHLGMRVTFEGVETTDQLERARALGVPSEGQGWLFGKPTAAADLHRIFAIEMEQSAVA